MCKNRQDAFQVAPGYHNSHVASRPVHMELHMAHRAKRK